jgi:hypothetical protein
MSPCGRSFFLTFDRVIAKRQDKSKINAKNLYTDRLKCAPGYPLILF